MVSPSSHSHLLSSRLAWMSLWPWRAGGELGADPDAVQPLPLGEFAALNRLSGGRLRREGVLGIGPEDHCQSGAGEIRIKGNRGDAQMLAQSGELGVVSRERILFAQMQHRAGSGGNGFHELTGQAKCFERRSAFQ